MSLSRRDFLKKSAQVAATAAAVGLVTEVRPAAGATPSHNTRFIARSADDETWICDLDGETWICDLDGETWICDRYLEAALKRNSDDNQRKLKAAFLADLAGNPTLLGDID